MSALSEIEEKFYNIESDNETALDWAIVRLSKDYSGKNPEFIEKAAQELLSIRSAAQEVINSAWYTDNLGEDVVERCIWCDIPKEDYLVEGHIGNCKIGKLEKALKGLAQ